MMLFLYW
jgi:hypothetical protein